MKKLLILALVVGLASVSYGVLVVPTASNIHAVLSGTTLTISSDIGLAAGNSMYFGIYDLSGTTTFSDGAALGSPATAGALRSIALFNDVSNGFGFNIWAGSTGLESPAWDAAAGSWYSVTWTGQVGASLDIENPADGYASVGSVIVTPEPVTIALLGLGGLFLRRRVA